MLGRELWMIPMNPHITSYMMYIFICVYTHIHTYITYIYNNNVIYVYIYTDRRSHQRYIMMTLNILLLAHMNWSDSNESCRTLWRRQPRSNPSGSSPMCRGWNYPRSSLAGKSWEVVWLPFSDGNDGRTS
jgi:hypothetical protein